MENTQYPISRIEDKGVDSNKREVVGVRIGRMAKNDSSIMGYRNMRGNKINTEHGTDYGFLCAGVLITVIPVMVVYLSFQKYFVEGMAGAVKS